jgi:Zn-finger nucleic acid-binding protein
MKCPVCEVVLSVSGREGVEIDFCPQCRGVWLDRGELDKIIERAGASGFGPTPVPERSRGGDDRYYDDPRARERPYARHDDDDRRYEPRYDDDRSYGGRRKKKRSFLDDIFDFD